MSAFGDTITGFPSDSGAIHLRTTERKPETHKDLHAAEGIILAALIGFNLLMVTYLTLRYFT